MSGRRAVFYAVVLLLLAVVGSRVNSSGASFTGSSSSSSAIFEAPVDWVAPSVPRSAITATTGGTPIGPVGSIGPSATYRVYAQVDDTNSGVSTVTVDLSALGNGTAVTMVAGSYTVDGVTYNYASPERTATTAASGSVDYVVTVTDNALNSDTATFSANVDSSGPVLGLLDPGATMRGSITLTATSNDPAGTATVVFERRVTGTTAWTTITCLDPTGSGNGTWTCGLDTTGLAEGDWDFRAVATDVLGNVTNSFVYSAVEVDNVLPAVSLADPGSPLKGTFTLTATPTENGSGVASIVFQRSDGAGGWVDLCTDTTAPTYTCDVVPPAVADGTYDFRARITDVAGNGPVDSNTVASRRIDNSAPVMTLTGAETYIGGTITLNATATDPSGFGQILIQRKLTSASTWTTICTGGAGVSPFSCTHDTTVLAEGSYDFRAIATDTLGNGPGESLHTNRTVDHTRPTAVDIQTTNAAGGTNGLPEAGDTVIYSYSEPVGPASLVAGWDGLGSTTVTLRFINGSPSDSFQIWNAANTAQLALGTVNSGKKYVTANVNFVNSTMTLVGNTVVVTLGTPDNPGAFPNNQINGQPNMTWTPGAAITDRAGNLLLSTAPVSEGGATSDRDF